MNELSYQERIESMKENMGFNFREQGKIILKDAKCIKGVQAEENFNTEINELTFELEELYPLNYEEFKKEFPKTIELVSTVTGSTVIDAVKKGIVIEGWAVKTNVDKTIQNIKNNIKDVEEQEKLIQLRIDVMNEIERMKEDFDMDWSQDWRYHHCPL